MPDTPYSQLRYNQVRARGSHNSFQRAEDIADQMVYWRLRHVELDVHTQRKISSSRGAIVQRPPDGNWYVYHEVYEVESPSVQLLSEGLALLAGFHRAVPGHEVVTLALDIKNAFTTAYSPEKLDTLVRTFLPTVWTPADYLAGLQNPASDKELRDAATPVWPLLQNLRGRFIVILTTGGLSEGSQLAQYVAGGAKNRTCFVAPQIATTADVTAAVNAPAVFFNMTVSTAVTVAPTVFQQGYVARAYGGNSRDEFDRAKTAKSHLIGTDNVNTDVDHWSRTHNVHGWPFEGIEVTPPASLAEAGLILQIFVNSSDIYGTADNCNFRYNVVTSPGTVTYTWAVSVASSHVANENGKAGLMARARRGKSAPNFAVLRVADNNQPRVQVRKTAGASTSEYKLTTADTSVPGITGESWMWLRLVLTNGGKTAEGFTSYDGEHFTSLHKEDFAEALIYQGLACSSHSPGHDARYYFIPGDGGVNRFATVVDLGDARGRSRRSFNVPVSDP